MISTYCTSLTRSYQTWWFGWANCQSEPAANHWLIQQPVKIMVFIDPELVRPLSGRETFWFMKLQRFGKHPCSNTSLLKHMFFPCNLGETWATASFVATSPYDSLVRPLEHSLSIQRNQWIPCLLLNLSGDLNEMFRSTQLGVKTLCPNNEHQSFPEDFLYL